MNTRLEKLETQMNCSFSFKGIRIIMTEHKRRNITKRIKIKELVVKRSKIF